MLFPMADDHGLSDRGFPADRGLNAEDFLQKFDGYDLLGTSIGSQMALMKHQQSVEVAHCDLKIMQDHQ